jgi:uncharacterized protein YaiE (UPF0345 family)
MTTKPFEQFDNASVVTKANVYFDGKVVSHTILLRGGEKKTIGLIYPGSFHFTTAAPERMDIIAGTCRARLADDEEWRTYEAGSGFDVPGESAFDISVESGIAEYVCSFK